MIERSGMEMGVYPRGVIGGTPGMGGGWWLWGMPSKNIYQNWELRWVARSQVYWVIVGG